MDSDRIEAAPESMPVRTQTTIIRTSYSYRLPRRPPTRRGMTLAALIGVLIAAAGVYFIGYGLHQRPLVTPKAGWVEVTGQVIWTSGECGRGCVPKVEVEFTDAQGAAHRFFGNQEPGNLGDSATVDYNPLDPAQAHDVSFPRVWWLYTVLGIGFIAIGLTLVTVTTVQYRRSRLRAA